MTKPKSETYYAIRAWGVYLLVVLVIVTSLLSAMVARATLPADTVTVGRVTSSFTETDTRWNVTTATFTWVQFHTVNQTQYQTVGAYLPPAVVFRGNASSKGLGTTATEIEFVSTGGTSSNAPVSGGRYIANVVNRGYYNVYIDFQGAVGGVGSGRCLAGALVLFSDVDQMSADWSC